MFGSNLAGAHGGGAARLAYNRFGAVWGEGVGLYPLFVKTNKVVFVFWFV